MRDFLLNLIPFYGFISNNFLNAFLSTSIFLFGLFEINRFYKITKGIQTKIYDIEQRLKKYLSNPSSYFNEIEKIFLGSDLLVNEWKKYKSTLIKRDDHNYIYKTEQAEKFFDEYKIISKVMNIRYWHALPGIFVGLGIFGTFVGLTYGISNFDVTNIESIKDSIKNMLSGTGTAFLTSVWGMIFSLFFNWYEKKRFSEISNVFSSFCNTINELFTLSTQQRIIIEQRDLLKQIEGAIKIFSTDLANKFAQSLREIIGIRLDEIKEIMKESIKLMIREISEMKDKIVVALKDTFEVTFNQNVIPAINEMKNSIEQLRREKQESSVSAIKNIIDSFSETLLSHTKTDFEKISSILVDASKKINSLPSNLEYIGNILMSSTKQIEDLMEAQKNIFTTTNDQISQSAVTAIDLMNDKVRQTIQIIDEKMQYLFNIQKTQFVITKELIDKTAQVFDNADKLVGEIKKPLYSLEKTASTLNSILESLGNYEKKNKDLLEQITFNVNKLTETFKNFGVYEEGIKNIFKEIESGLVEYSSQVRISIENYLKDFSNQLSEVVKYLSGAIDELSDNIEDLNDIFDKINKK